MERSPIDQRDLLVGQIYDMQRYTPKSFSLRNKLIPVQDQNGGTCVAYSISCMLSYIYNFPHGININDIYQNRENRNSNGMFCRDALKISQKIGVNVNKVNYKLKQYARIETIKELQLSIMINGPCIISFPLYNYSSEPWMPEFRTQKKLGGHVMTIIGWTKKGFIIRNSWGKNWNNNGHCIYKYKYWGKHWEIWTAISYMSYHIHLGSNPNWYCCIPI